MANSIIDGQLVLTLQTLSQRLTFHVRHYVVQKPLGLARVEQREYVRMIEARHHSDLAEEPLRPH